MAAPASPVPQGCTMTLDDDDPVVPPPKSPAPAILGLGDVEERVIGSVLLNPECYRSVRARVGPEDFQVRINRRIWEAVDRVVEAGEPIELVSVWHRLQQLECGAADQAALLRTMDTTVVSTNAEYYAKRVQEESARRRLEEIGTEVGKRAAGQITDRRSMGEIIAGAEAALMEMQARMRGGDATGIGVLVAAEVESYQRSFETGDLPGVRTGFAAVDREIGTLPNGSVTVIGARPSMGKSSMASQIAQHVARHCGPVMYFPIETNAGQLTMNMMSQVSGVPAETITERKPMTEYDFEKYLKAAEIVNALPIWVDGSSALKVREAWGRAAALKARHGLAMVVVDYLQLMEPESVRGLNREQQVSEVSRGLRKMAGSLGVPVLACSQLKRTEGSERPKLQDLRESGQIEQDADVVLLLHREEYYKKDDPSVAGWAEVIVAKRKIGRRGAVIRVGFDGPALRFYDRAEGA